MILSKFLDSLADHKLLVLGIGIPLGAALAYTALKPTSAKSEVQLTGRHRVVRIHVPRGKIGAVIGQSGNVIRGLENHHKVIIQFSRKEEDLVDPTISILIIRGRTENVNAAEIEVRSILAAAPATISEEIEVPRASLGIIIGKAGETIKEIINLSRAKVKIHASGNDPEIIVICGKPQCVEHAKELIFARLSNVDETRTQIKEVVARRTRVDPSALFQNPQKNFFGLHPGAKVSVYISAVVNPTEFFVQLISRQLLVLDRLTNEMQIYYGDQESTSETFIEGEYVAALSEHDGKYYRAVINELNNGRADVKFVDYGEDAYVALSDLRKLPVEFFRLPLQAIACKLAKVHPMDGNWSDAACQLFEQISHCAKWRELQATLISERQGIAEICLYDMANPKEPKDIAFELVRKGFAVFDTEDCGFAQRVEQSLDAHAETDEDEQPSNNTDITTTDTSTVIELEQSVSETVAINMRVPPKPGLSPWSPWSRHTLSRDSSALADITGTGHDESFSSAREALSRVDNFSTPAADRFERPLPPFMQMHKRLEDEENLDMSDMSDYDTEEEEMEKENFSVRLDQTA